MLSRALENPKFDSKSVWPVCLFRFSRQQPDLLVGPTVCTRRPHRVKSSPERLARVFRGEALLASCREREIHAKLPYVPWQPSQSCLLHSRCVGVAAVEGVSWRTVAAQNPNSLRRRYAHQLQFGGHDESCEIGVLQEGVRERVDIIRPLFSQTVRRSCRSHRTRENVYHPVYIVGMMRLG